MTSGLIYAIHLRVSSMGTLGLELFLIKQFIGYTHSALWCSIKPQDNEFTGESMGRTPPIAFQSSKVSQPKSRYRSAFNFAI